MGNNLMNPWKLNLSKNLIHLRQEQRNISYGVTIHSPIRYEVRSH